MAEIEAEIVKDNVANSVGRNRDGPANEEDLEHIQNLIREHYDHLKISGQGK